jgi:UDPglucose 6-dehydrogenase
MEGPKKHVAVLGLGRLGVCFAVVLERAGYAVTGVDVNPNIVEAVNKRQCLSTEPGLDEALANTVALKATTDLAQGVSETKIIFVLVPTPNSGGRNYYDHSILSNVLFRLNSLKLSNKHIVICSTVMPGYVNGTGRFLLRDCQSTTLSYNPAFVAQGDIMEGYRTGGWFGLVLVGQGSEEAGTELKEIYEMIAPRDQRPNICLMSPESAEIAKLASNCFRTTKISFCNMVADLADRTPGADRHDICSALARDASIGPVCMRPGYGYGGPCYPRDNQALALYARRVGVNPCLPLATHEYNEFHHGSMADALLREGREEYVLEDVAYKPRCAVAMIDESPKLQVATRLVEAGRRVVIRDRVAVCTRIPARTHALFQSGSTHPSIHRCFYLYLLIFPFLTLSLPRPRSIACCLRPTPLVGFRSLCISR